MFESTGIRLRIDLREEPIPASKSKSSSLLLIVVVFVFLTDGMTYVVSCKKPNSSYGSKF